MVCRCACPAAATPARATCAVRELGFDQPLLWVVVTLLMWGLVMVYSASIAMPDNPRFAQLRTYPLRAAPRACRYAIGLHGAALIAFQVPIATWEKLAPWLFAVALVLLMLVLVPFIGKGVNGARRWIRAGVMNFQPSELAKFRGAALRGRLHGAQDGSERALLPRRPAHGGGRAVVGMLLLAEPDMGAFMVIVGDRHGHPVPGRRQRPYVLPDCGHWWSSRSA